MLFLYYFWRIQPWIRLYTERIKLNFSLTFLSEFKSRSNPELSKPSFEPDPEVCQMVANVYIVTAYLQWAPHP